MGLTKDDVRAVLDTYIKAWETQDPDLIVTIFTPAATYHERVMKDPIPDREAIRDYWQSKVVGAQAKGLREGFDRPGVLVGAEEGFPQAGPGVGTVGVAAHRLVEGDHGLNELPPGEVDSATPAQIGGRLVHTGLQEEGTQM